MAITEAKKTKLAKAITEAVATPVEQPEIKVVAVVPQLMQDVLNLLQTELPMKTVRGVVSQLEQCPIMVVNQTPKE